MNERMRRLKAAAILGAVAMGMALATMAYAALSHDIAEAACFGLLAAAGYAVIDRAGREFEAEQKSRGETIPP